MIPSSAQNGPRVSGTAGFEDDLAHSKDRKLPGWSYASADFSTGLLETRRDLRQTVQGYDSSSGSLLLVRGIEASYTRTE